MSCHPGAVRPSRLLAWIVSSVLAANSLAGCNYARMTDDDAVNTFQTKMPSMPEHTVPVDGGNERLLTTPPADLVNPQPNTQASITKGKLAYGYYCVHCHGPMADGLGTVGQSFSPLPANLTLPAIQGQSDGALFVKVSLGYKRCPPLAHTVEESDRWAIINYLRSLVPSSGKR